MNVIAIGGSLRRASYNRLLLRAAKDASIPMFDEDIESGSGLNLSRVCATRSAQLTRWIERLS